MWIAGIAACGNGDPKDPLGDGSFAALNKDKLDYDCRQVVACNDMRKTDATGGYDDCLSQNAQKLNDNPSAQPTFLTKYSRCNLHTACDYTTCVSVDPVMSYGMTQLPKLTYVCQAKAQCHTDMGTPVDDAMNAIANCAGLYVGTLDTWSLPQRDTFVQTFDGCSTLASCQFLACFPY